MAASTCVNCTLLPGSCCCQAHTAITLMSSTLCVQDDRGKEAASPNLAASSSGSCTEASAEASSNQWQQEPSLPVEYIFDFLPERRKAQVLADASRIGDCALPNSHPLAEDRITMLDYGKVCSALHQCCIWLYVLGCATPGGHCVPLPCMASA